ERRSKAVRSVIGPSGQVEDARTATVIGLVRRDSAGHGTTHLDQHDLERIVVRPDSDSAVLPDIPPLPTQFEYVVTRSPLPPDRPGNRVSVSIAQNNVDSMDVALMANGVHHPWPGSERFLPRR